MIVADRGIATRLTEHDRHFLLDQGPQHVHRLLRLAPRIVQKSFRDQWPAAADSGRHRDMPAGRCCDLDGGNGYSRFVKIGERVSKKGKLPAASAMPPLICAPPIKKRLS